MEALDHKCPSCGAVLKFSPKEQKWSCDYCGSKFSLEELQKYKNASSVEVNQKKDVKVEQADVYRCSSCGAEIIADENTTATFCVYCGNTAILKERIQNSRVPDYIIPFQKVKEDATSAFLQLVKHKPLVPRTFKSRKNIDKITGVYIPFWAYDFDVVCEGSMNYDKVLADGSSRFSDELMDSLEPFDYTSLTEYNHAFLSGFLSEKYDVLETQAIERARNRTLNTTVSLLQDKIRHQSITPVDNNISLKNVHSNYILLPVFMVNIKYHDKMYTFAMNGQTGKIVGCLPLGVKEVILWSCGIFLLCLAVCIALYFGGVI